MAIHILSSHHYPNQIATLLHTFKNPSFSEEGRYVPLEKTVVYFQILFSTITDYTNLLSPHLLSIYNYQRIQY